MGEGDGGDCPPKNVLFDSAAAALPLDGPGKKLARQLDFTGFGGVSGTVASNEHPLLQLQPQSHPQSLPQGLTQQTMVVMPVPPQVPHSSVTVGKPESPKSRSRPNFEMKDSTPKKQKQCNCKHSRCLKFSTVHGILGATCCHSPSMLEPPFIWINRTIQCNFPLIFPLDCWQEKLNL